MTRFVSYLADEAIEKDAQALLAEYAHARGIHIEPPIAIEDIIEKHLRIGIEFDDTHRRFGVPRHGDPDILGAIFFDLKRIVIDESLDPDVNPAREGRYRYTAAHEVGHWRLHRELFANDPAQTSLLDSNAPPSVICRSSQAKARIELQADRLEHGRESSVAATDAALTKPIVGVARLSREFISGYGDAAKFESANQSFPASRDLGSFAGTILHM